MKAAQILVLGLIGLGCATAVDMARKGYKIVRHKLNESAKAVDAAQEAEAARS